MWDCELMRAKSDKDWLRCASWRGLRTCKSTSSVQCRVFWPCLITRPKTGSTVQDAVELTEAKQGSTSRAFRLEMFSFYFFCKTWTQTNKKPIKLHQLSIQSDWFLCVYLQLARSQSSLTSLNRESREDVTINEEYFSLRDNVLFFLNNFYTTVQKAHLLIESAVQQVSSWNRWVGGKKTE